MKSGENINMKVLKTNINGVVIIEPLIFEDARGYFFESFSQREFDEKVRPISFAQKKSKQIFLWLWTHLATMLVYNRLR